MLDHLRQRIVEALESTNFATLATDGPAGLLANVFPCQTLGTYIYLCLPRTSDHLVNLEASDDAVVTTLGWQARGKVRRLPERPADLPFAADADPRWCEVVELRPSRIQMERASGWGAMETIDVDLLRDVSYLLRVE